MLAAGPCRLLRAIAPSLSAKRMQAGDILHFGQHRHRRRLLGNAGGEEATHELFRGLLGVVFAVAPVLAPADRPVNWLGCEGTAMTVPFGPWTICGGLNLRGKGNSSAAPVGPAFGRTTVFVP